MVLPNRPDAGPARTLGLDKSKPASESRPSSVEPTKVNPKLTRNWMESRRSFPNIKFWTTADKTNIQANPQMKPAEAELELNHDATSGIGPLSDAAAVVKAV